MLGKRIKPVEVNLPANSKALLPIDVNDVNFSNSNSSSFGQFWKAFSPIDVMLREAPSTVTLSRLSHSANVLLPIEPYKVVGKVTLTKLSLFLNAPLFWILTWQDGDVGQMIVVIPQFSNAPPWISNSDVTLLKSNVVKLEQLEKAFDLIDNLPEILPNVAVAKLEQFSKA